MSLPNLENMLAQPGDHGDEAAYPEAKVTDPKGWEPRVLWTPHGVPQTIFSPPLPAGLPAADVVKTILEALGQPGAIPPGYVAFIAETKIDSHAWKRDGQWEENPDTGKNSKSQATTTVAVRYKITVARASSVPDLPEYVDYNALMEQAAKIAKGRKIPVPAGAEARSLVIGLADFQAGQKDGGGPKALADRLAMIPVAVRAEVQRLKKAGTPVGHLVFVGLGDLVESCDGFYSTQLWNVMLNRRDQVKLVRRALMHILADAADTGLQVTIAAVGGNHGEHRSGGIGGKVKTDYADNDDISVFEQVADAFSQNPDRYGHIRWCLPEGESLTLTLDVQGYVLGITHGHLAKGSGNPMAKQKSWFNAQAGAHRDIGASRVLFTAHYHSQQCADLSESTVWVQASALCDRSDWFSQSFGLESRKGLTTFTIERGVGFDNLRLHDLDAMCDGVATT